MFVCGRRRNETKLWGPPRYKGHEVAAPSSHNNMPRYELALILKTMQRPEMAAALRRTVEALLENGAVVRNLENLGERTLPYKISKHNLRHTRGGYFTVDFNAPPAIVPTMLDHLDRDIDVVRPTILKQKQPTAEDNCAGLIQPDYEAKLRSKRK
ncbi:small ribosomal subunit protein bS6m [Rhinoraja longicauda]